MNLGALDETKTPFQSWFHAFPENPVVMPENNEVDTGNKPDGTETTFKGPHFHTVPVKDEMGDIDTCINDEGFYQQSEKPPETNRLINQEVVKGMPSSVLVENPITTVAPNIFLPSALTTTIKVESVGNVSLSAVATLPEEKNSEEPSMLLDPMFSEMDVSALLLTETKLSKPDRIRRKVTRTLKAIDGNIDKTSDPQSEARRSMRKRSLPETFNIETPSRPSSKRRRLSLKRKLVLRKVVRRRVKNGVAHGGNPPFQQIASLQAPPEKPEEPQEKKPDNDLKIVFRKYAPVNPVNKHRIGNHRYRKGLISGVKHISASLYFSRGIEPKTAPGIRLESHYDDSDKQNEKFPNAYKPMGIEKVKDKMRLEWITNWNLIGNYRAHGQKVLDEAGKKLTLDGNAVRGSMVMINLDNIYDKLLDIQESIIPPNHSLTLNAGPSSPQPQPLLLTTSGNTPTHSAVPNLNSTLGNEFNFANDYFEDSDYSDGRYGNDGIYGATRVGKRKLDSAFLDKHPVFGYKDELYMVNTAVVLVVRTPDKLIKDIMASPKKVSFESPFYNALTSYFDNK